MLPSENHEHESQQNELERLHEQQALLQKIVDQQKEVRGLFSALLGINGQVLFKFQMKNTLKPIF